MKDYRYTVDGEKSPSTISNRVRTGWRTWAELMRAPDKVQQARRKGARR